MTPAESRALMLREIDEQPQVLRRAAGPLLDAADRVRPQRDRPIWVGGCGDSVFAAEALTGHFRALGWDMRPATAAALLWDAPIGPGDAVVCISISGTTRRTVEALSAATARGARTLAVTLNSDSALARAAGATLLLPFEPISRAIPHGLDYQVTLLALAALAGGVDVEAVARRLDRGPDALAEARQQVVAFQPQTRFFFLGAGAALGSAQYGAAKMHEAGGLAAWAFESENFAHGAQFMMRPGDHVSLYGAGGGGDRRTLALRDGLLRLGATVDAAGFDAPPHEAATAAALHAQTLCLAVAEARGLDVTDPSRGTEAAAVQKDWFGWSSG